MAKRLGIIVGGGPAPGINGVIGAATIEAINRGIEVVGFYDGFRRLCSDTFDAWRDVVRLDIPMVARIHFDGGSILRTARTSLLDEESLTTSTVVRPDPVKMQRVMSALRGLNISYLLTIGGDDTALSARFICEEAARAIRVVHVPKTIDNDLPLPHDVATFGFSTARYYGTLQVKNLMRDSQTTGRWYLIAAMGRSAGWLAMSIGLAAGATLTLIPEEFAEQTKVHHIVDVVEAAMLKRRVMGRPDGVAIIAEGLAYRLGDRRELERLLGREVPVDAAGHPRLAEVLLVKMVKSELQERFQARGEAISLVSLEMGYELRSADPAPADMAYCRSLGYGSIQLLLHGSADEPAGKMVTFVNGNLVPMDFQDMIDPETNRTRVRLVDVRSDVYRVARAYQIRLERSDLEDPTMLAKLAAEAKMAPADFRQRYERAASQLADRSAAEAPQPADRAAAPIEP
ncbi:MAG: 6-phosphofructokinase [Planctomycetes bacterium]|nr:6-phosphofructokinase [Planctomycetota bacterium]